MFNSSKCPQNISMTFNYCKTGGICMEGDSFSISKIIKILTGCTDLWSAAGNASPRTVLEHNPDPWQGRRRPRARLDLHLSNLTSFHSLTNYTQASVIILLAPESAKLLAMPTCAICSERSSLRYTYSYSAVTSQMSSPQRNFPSPPALSHPPVTTSLSFLVFFRALIAFENYHVCVYMFIFCLLPELKALLKNCLVHSYISSTKYRI